MYDKDGLIEFLHERLTRAIAYKERIGINKSLKHSDEIMFGDRVNCTERDMNQNFLRRKIFSLYTLLSNQLESQRQRAVGVELTGDDDVPDQILNSVADELVSELLYQKSIDNDRSQISLNAFLESIRVYEREKYARLERDVNEVIANIEPELRKAMFSAKNKEEIRNVLRDYVMYPACFVVGTYEEKAHDQDFVNGRVVESDETRITFRRVSPWRVFPMPTKGKVKDIFTVEDLSIDALYDLAGDERNAEGVEAVIEAMHDKKDDPCAWFNKLLLLTVEGDGDNYEFIDDINVARSVMYDGAIPNKYLVEGGTGNSFGQVWFVGKEVIFEKISGKQRVPMVLSARFRQGRYGVWGLSTVDLCYRIQKTIDFVGSKIVSNIEKLSDIQGLLEKSVAKSLVKDKKSFDGKMALDITGIRAADLPPNRAPFYGFPIRNSQQSGILLINELKKHIAELLSLPDFIDGSTNVGTVGRTSGGLFLLQRNLSEGIEVVRAEFANDIIVPIGRSILEKLRDQGKLSKVILNYDVVVRDFALQEERSETADELLKRIQAITQLQQLMGANGIPVQNNDALNNLHDSIISNIAPETVAQAGSDNSGAFLQQPPDGQV